MLSRVNTKKLVSYIPDIIPVEEAIAVFAKLDEMEDAQNINWEILIKEIESWSVNKNDE